jgi:glycosyltransferase involved in cell wall biosynthesis
MSQSAPRRRRLLVVASTFPASAQDSAPAFVRDLAVHESTGYDTTVLVPAVPGGERDQDVSGLRVHRFRYFPRRWEDLAEGAILENLRQRRTRWLQVVPFLIAETLALRRMVRKFDPDILHVHWIIPQGVAALLGRRGRPMLVTTLGGDIYGLRDPISRRVIAAVLRRSAAVTTMNSDMQDRLVELGAQPGQVAVLPMGADVDGIRSLSEGITSEPGRILFVGRLVEKKGVAVLIEALRRLPEGSFSLIVVGDGPLRTQLMAAAAGLPVTFRGALHRSELAREYARASAVVFPSVAAASGDQDGLPVALLEAMAAGRPVLASDLPGLRDAIVDGESGLLFPPGDSDVLARMLRDVLTDPERAAALGRGAWERAEQYSVSSVGERYLALLDRICADPGQPILAAAPGE